MKLKFPEEKYLLKYLFQEYTRQHIFIYIAWSHYLAMYIIILTTHYGQLHFDYNSQQLQL